jgi:hypothetical protein
MYQRDGSWDGPSNPIPNVGSARARCRISVQHGLRLRHHNDHRVTRCWGRAGQGCAKSASSNMSNLPWSQGSLPDRIEPAACALPVGCTMRHPPEILLSNTTSPGCSPELGCCNTPQAPQAGTARLHAGGLPGHVPPESRARPDRLSCHLPCTLETCDLSLTSAIAQSVLHY